MTAAARRRVLDARARGRLVARSRSSPASRCKQPRPRPARRPTSHRRRRRPPGDRRHRQRGAVRRHGGALRRLVGARPPTSCSPPRCVALVGHRPRDFLLPNRIVYPLTIADAGAARAGGSWPTATRRLRPRPARGRDRVRGLLRAPSGVAARHGLRRREAVVHPRSLARVARMGRDGARPVPRLPLRRGDRPPAHRHQAAGARTRPCPSVRSSPPVRSPRILVGIPILDWYRGS